jgi:hypothetical protein
MIYKLHARRALKLQRALLFNLIKTHCPITNRPYLPPSTIQSMSSITINLYFITIGGDTYVDDRRQSSSYVNSFNRISSTMTNSQNIGGRNARNEEGSSDDDGFLHGKQAHLTDNCIVLIIIHIRSQSQY